jgi:hypothetical protein
MPDDQIEVGRDIEDLTLKELLPPASGDIPDPSVAGGVESEDLRNLQKQLSISALPIAWSRVQSEVSGMLSSVMNTGVLDLWAHGWEKYQGLMDDVEKSRNSPRATVLSPLAEHSIETKLHPFLEIYLGPKKIQTLYFDVTLTTRIKGLVLSLKNGRITSLQLVECEWKGSIGIKNAILVSRPLGKLKLPGRIELKRGILLGHPSKT